MSCSKIVLAASAGLMMVSIAATAAAPAPAEAIATRKANFKEIGGAFKSINDEIKSGAPNMNTVRPLARDMAARAAAALKYFPSNSGPDSGLKTRAKASIWANQADFVKLQNNLIDAANALNEAATSGDVAQLTAARNTAGQACKACHDKYREPDT